MSELSGLLGNLTPVAHNPASDAAAVRAVMLRVDRGQLDRAGARRILEALGLVAYESAGRYRPNGIRESKGKRLRRPESDEGREVTRVTDRDPSGRYKSAQGQDRPD